MSPDFGSGTISATLDTDLIWLVCVNFEASSDITVCHGAIMTPGLLVSSDMSICYVEVCLCSVLMSCCASLVGVLACLDTAECRHCTSFDGVESRMFHGVIERSLAVTAEGCEASVVCECIELGVGTSAGCFAVLNCACATWTLDELTETRLDDSSAFVGITGETMAEGLMMI